MKRVEPLVELVPLVNRSLSLAIKPIEKQEAI